MERIVWLAKAIKKNRKRLSALSIIFAIVLSFFMGYSVASNSNSSEVFTLSSGIYPSATSYTVYVEDGTYYVKNAYGVQVYSTSYADQAFEYAYENSGEPSTIYVASGTYVLTDPIEFTVYRVDVRIIGGREVSLKIQNDDCGILIGAGSKITIEGLNLQGVEGYNGYGIRVVNGTALIFENLIGYQLNNWMILLNASYANVNYIYIDNVHCIQSYGFLKQIRDQDGHQMNSMTLFVSNVGITHNTNYGVWLECNDANFASIAGEIDNGHFFVLNSSAAIQIHNFNIEAGNGYTFYIFGSESKHLHIYSGNIWYTKVGVYIDSDAGDDIVIDGVSMENITQNCFTILSENRVFLDHIWTKTSGITPLNLATNNEVTITDSYFYSLSSDNLYNNVPYRMRNVKFNKAGTIYYSENSGTATIVTSTNTVVTHHLIAQPTVISISPRNGGYGTFYVSSVSSTSFKIYVTNTGTYNFYWYASVTG